MQHQIEEHFSHIFSTASGFLARVPLTVWLYRSR